MVLFRKVFCFLLALPVVVLSQNEARYWYFGTNAGLDFSTSPPTVLTNGMINTFEGCASISDAAGNLLFYTDGITIYTKTHVPMNNGNGMTGNPSSTQSAIIVKQPGSQNLYHVFTLGANGVGTLCVSTVDMALSAGNGSVITKNMFLSSGMSEKLTSVKHCNGSDVWVLSHENNSDKFLAYLVSATGVNTTAIVSAIGSTYTGNTQCIGNLKVSPNGRKICAAIHGTQGSFELFDFNTVSGVLSNSLSLGAFKMAYGCEFSPDGSKLYGTTSLLSLNQWNLCSGTATAIAASLFTMSVPSQIMGMQLATDGKIYITNTQQNDLAVINDPNNLGAACNYTHTGQSVAPKKSMHNLPNFMTSFFKEQPEPFTFSLTCSTATFNAPSLTNTVNAGCDAVVSKPTSVLWSFGDVASGPANSSTLTSPVHTYPGAGNYSVQVIYYNTCSNDTLRSIVTVTNAAPSLSLTGTFTICAGEKRVYTASGATTYTWHNGATTPSIALSPSVTTTFSLTGAGNSPCLAKRMFTITVNKCTGIDPLSEDRSFFMYPNPAKSTLYIETVNPARIKIMDKSGELLVERWFESGNHSLDISSFSTGVYIVQSITGKSVKTMRLVKIE